MLMRLFLTAITSVASEGLLADKEGWFDVHQTADKG